MAKESKDITLIVSLTTRQLSQRREERGREKEHAAPEAPGKLVPSLFSTQNYNVGGVWIGENPRQICGMSTEQ